MAQRLFHPCGIDLDLPDCLVRDDVTIGLQGDRRRAGVLRLRESQLGTLTAMIGQLIQIAARHVACCRAQGQQAVAPGLVDQFINHAHGQAELAGHVGNAEHLAVEIRILQHQVDQEGLGNTHLGQIARRRRHAMEDAIEFAATEEAQLDHRIADAAAMLLLSRQCAVALLRGDQSFADQHVSQHSHS